jgi:hypothetical protein
MGKYGGPRFRDLTPEEERKIKEDRKKKDEEYLRLLNEDPAKQIKWLRQNGRIAKEEK